MAVDKLVDSTQLNSDLTSIANAIRTKGGTSSQLAFPSGFVSAVQNIPTGGNTLTIAYSESNGVFTFTTSYADIKAAIQGNYTIDYTLYGDDAIGGIYSQGYYTNITVGGVTFTECVRLNLQGTDDKIYTVTYGYSGGSLQQVAEEVYYIPSGTKSITSNGTGIDVKEYASVNVNVGGSGIQWEHIGTQTFQKEEYTDTTASEVTDTGINVKNTDYAFILTVITCDSAITTSTEWGITIALGGRYTSNGAYYNYANCGQKGSSTLSLAGMVATSLGWASYGVTVNGNTNTIMFSRKAHGTACPKIRGGVYTVSVYGLKSL